MIREFKRADTPAVLEMVDELRQESPLHRGLPYDPEHVARVINSFTVRGWVSETEGTLRGACFATVVPSLLGPGKICTDLSVFVRKPYRNGLIAARFLRKMHEYGRELGCHQWQHVVSTSNPAIERMYERFGYVRTGAAFVKQA